MRFSAIIATALSAASVLAAPVNPAVDRAVDNFDTLSDYFNMLAEKVSNSASMSEAPVCDLSKAQMPEAPVSLPKPAEGLYLKHVAIGRGIQNYTCTPNNASDTPKAIGAVATLYNASCVAATYPELANMLPRVALQFNLSDGDLYAALPQTVLAPSNLAVSGKHFFNVNGAPFFNLNTSSMEIGSAACARNASSDAPADAARGQQGEKAVPWLKLNSTAETGNIKEVYRLETAGGSAPTTCEGMPASFQVQYAAQYWFFEGPDSEQS